MEETKQGTAASKEKAGAVTHEPDETSNLDGEQKTPDWEQIDWPALEREVNRLQTRIVKAEKEGRHNKVKALQYLLTRSRAAKLLAVRRVTQNQGSRTPGVDGHT